MLARYRGWLEAGRRPVQDAGEGGTRMSIATAVEAGTDLVEYYYAAGWTDGLPVVPPTPAKVADFVAALGGEPDLVECKVAPRWGLLTREVLAVNAVMAGCLPAYAPVLRAAMLALATPPST